MSKTGSECVTTSTDGKVMWWDTRKFDAGPVEKLNIVEGLGENDEIIGGTALEYNVEAGVITSYFYLLLTYLISLLTQILFTNSPPNS